MEKTNNEREFYQRFAKALCEVPNPELDGTNPHFRSKYATLESVLKAIRPTLAKHGLAVSQSVSTNEDEVSVFTAVIDTETGATHNIISTYPLPDECRRNIQKMGAAITYLRRYTLLSIFAIVGEPDDDGNLAVGNQPTQPKPRPKQEKPQNDPPKATREDLQALYRAAVKAGLDKEGAKKFTLELGQGATKQTIENIIARIQTYVDGWVRKMEEGQA